MRHASTQDSTLAAYVALVRERKWFVATGVILVPLVAVLVTLQQAPEYQGRAEVYLNKQNVASAITGIQGQLQYGNEDRQAQTQADLASVDEVARRALLLAGVTDMTPSELRSSSSVATKSTSDILGFTVRDADPERAKALASAYAKAFTEYRAHLDSGAIAKAHRVVAGKLALLATQGKTDSQLYASLFDKEQQLATLEILQTSPASVVQQANKVVQVAPTPLRNGLLALGLGLVLGLAAAFAVDALDTRVRNPAEVGERLRLPQLAWVTPPPRGFRRSDRLLMLTQPTAPAAEAFRMLRANLEFSLLDATDVRTILVTSAVGEEGKSTTAANAAIAFARSGKSVALVDLDLRSPSIAQLFGVANVSGATDVALGHVELRQALHHVDLGLGTTMLEDPVWEGRSDRSVASERGTLSLLLSGPLPPNPGEFVGTRRVAEVLRELRSSFDLVIIDTPPVLLVGDAMTLSAQADGIVAVTRLNVVRRPMLAELHRVLESVRTPKLGYIVTGSRSRRSLGYGYGYGYGYHHGRVELPEPGGPGERGYRPGEKRASAREAELL